MSNPFHIQLHSVVYNRNDPETDFYQMIKQEKYQNFLFIYNENERQYINKEDTRRGAGNAIIRPYRHSNSIGIPTGILGRDPSGYQDHEFDHAKKMIDQAFEEIHARIVEKRFEHVIYSAQSKKDDLIGTDLFRPGDLIKQYITSRLKELETIQFE